MAPAESCKGLLPRNSYSARGEGLTLAFRQADPPAGAWPPVSCCCRHRDVLFAHTLRPIRKVRQPRSQASVVSGVPGPRAQGTVRIPKKPLWKVTSHECVL